MPGQFPAVIELSDIQNGYGFIINGAPSDGLGKTLYNIDINGDGVNDLLIRSSHSAYIVFANSTINNFNISNLNGRNGFAIPFGSLGIGVVNNIGDINGDGIDDLIFGSSSCTPVIGRTYAGCSYVLFGSPSIGRNGVVQLAAVNGTNGFKIYGAATNDMAGPGYTGMSIDVNNDGYIDILMNAQGNNVRLNYRGYAIFGGPDIGKSGILDLATINGTNGFVVDGVGSLNGICDINADGYDDILTFGYNSPSCIVFGNPHINKSILNCSYLNGQNGFSLYAGAGDRLACGDINDDGRNDLIIGQPAIIVNGLSTGVISVIFGNPHIDPAVGIFRNTLVSLNGSNGFYIHVNHKSNWLGGSVSVGDVDGDGIDDIIGADLYDSPENRTGAGSTYVIFGKPSVWSSILELGTLNGTNGFAVYGAAPNGASGTSVSAVDMNLDGLEDIIIGANGVKPLNTTSDGRVYVVWGAYNIAPPHLIHNQLTIQEKGTTILSSQNLNATDMTYPLATLIFAVNNVQHGYFQLASTPGKSISSFTQSQVWANQVVFVQDGSVYAPSYEMRVGNGFTWSAWAAANITYISVDNPPVLLSNYLYAEQGRSRVLKPSDWQTTDIDPGTNISALTYLVSNVRHGKFNTVQNPQIAITQFTQGQVDADQIEFTQDGTRNPPTYDIAVSDGVLTISPQPGNITFDSAPIFLTNQLNIAPGQTIRLDFTELLVTDDFTPPGQLLITVDEVTHGYFSSIQTIGSSLPNFTQQQVTAGSISFVHDGSDQAPAYSLTAIDSVGLSTGLQAAKITFNIPGSAVSTNTVRNAIIGAVISGVVGFGFFACQLWIKHKAESYLERATEEKEGIGKEQAEFYKNVLRPMAKRILGRLKLSGLFGYVSDDTLKDALSAITILVHELQKQGIEVDLTKLTPIERTRLLDAVARKTRQILVPETKCCSPTWFSRLFCPEVTSVQMEEQAQNIAKAVKLALENSTLLIPSPSLDFKEGAQQPSVELQPVAADPALDQSTDVEINRISDELAVSQHSRSKNRNSFLVSTSEQQSSTGVSENLENTNSF